MTKSNQRMWMGITLWTLIYAIPLYLVPKLPPVQRLVGSSFLNSSDVTQILFLIASLCAIAILARGDWASFGFQTVRIRTLIKPSLLAAISSFALFILILIVMSVTSANESTTTTSGPASDSSPMMPPPLRFFFSVVLIASICEEVLYRGLLQTSLEPLKHKSITIFRTRLTLPVLLSGLFFGLGHLCLIGRFETGLLAHVIISCTIFGWIAGYYREKTGSLIPAIAAHMSANIVGYGVPALLTELVAFTEELDKSEIPAFLF